MATILCSCGHPGEATMDMLKKKGYKLNYNNRDAKPVILKTK